VPHNQRPAFLQNRESGFFRKIEKLQHFPPPEALVAFLDTDRRSQTPAAPFDRNKEELLPETGGLNYAKTRNRTLAVGKRIEEEIRAEIDHPRVVPEPAERMVVGIDGALVKAGHTRPGQRHQFEILTGRVETSERGGEAFAVVRDLDPYAKRRVQAILRRCGRGQDTDVRILSDGEDGLRGVVGTWFGKKCQHRLDWFHVARRIARIEKEFL